MSSQAATPKPSKVLHFRNVLPPITQSEILELCQQAGPVEYIMMLPNSNQAFVQFESQTTATAFLNQASRYPVKIRNVTLYVQYSLHDSIQQKPTQRVEGAPSRVLLVTIHNPLYPISIEVLSQIFSPYDKSPAKKVEKIIIFQKRSGLQALIQFSDIDSAAAAMRELNGKNIYKSCCTLQIQFSKQTELTVQANSEHTHDFTNPELPERRGKGFGPSSGMVPSYGGMAQTGYPSYPGSVPGMMSSMSMGSSMSQMSGGVPQMFRNVVIVNGFDPEQIGCDQLFNLFSNYGNIVRIKILHDKRNTALVQFTDPLMASNAVQYLKDVVVCGSKLSVNFSKFPEISPSREIKQQMLSGHHFEPTPSEGRASSDGRTVEYEESSLNRYLSGNYQTNLRYVTAPTQYLHVYSLAPSVTEASLSHLMEKIAKPVAIKLFEKNQRRMALVQMPSVELAVNAMCFLHNEVLDQRHIRLAFTKSRL